MNITNLQLGISNPKLLSPASVKVFSDGTWINLGDTSKIRSRQSLFSNLHAYISSIRRKYIHALQIRDRKNEDYWRETIRKMHLQPFWWSKGMGLPFTSNTFGFIFSEHFFEHIFMDEAHELLVECNRIIKANGVLRISVPDADLRTYSRYEPFAFDAVTRKPSQLGWNHPDTHKTRWNIYSLSLILKLTGFTVIPIVYCDRDGKFFSKWPNSKSSAYPDNSDWELICNHDYLQREVSLIIDAIPLKKN